MIKPLKMVPAFKDYIWGGNRLRDEYNKVSSFAIIAESWEVSTHPDGLSTIAGGEFDGATLRAALDEHPEWLGDACAQSKELPVLIKLIDAQKPLSLQVHPNDEYAYRVEGQAGKNEMWYVVSAKPGAELILGFTQTLTKQQLREFILSGDILNYVRRVKVKAGDCYAIPAGLMHAIGEGIVIAEVQQCSNVTYRVYDYGRVDSEGKPRELHIDKALDVLDTSVQAKLAEGDVLVNWEYFKCSRIMLDIGDAPPRLPLTSRKVTSRSFECLTVTDVDDVCAVSLKSETGELLLKKGESVFLPAGLGEYVLAVDSGSAEILFTQI